MKKLLIHSLTLCDWLYIYFVWNIRCGTTETKIKWVILVTDRHSKKRLKESARRSVSENELGRRKRESAFLKANDRSISRNVRSWPWWFFFIASLSLGSTCECEFYTIPQGRSFLIIPDNFVVANYVFSLNVRLFVCTVSWKKFSQISVKLHSNKKPSCR